MKTEIVQIYFQLTGNLTSLYKIGILCSLVVGVATGDVDSTNSGGVKIAPKRPCVFPRSKVFTIFTLNGLFRNPLLSTIISPRENSPFSSTVAKTFSLSRIIVESITVATAKTSGVQTPFVCSCSSSGVMDSIRKFDFSDPALRHATKCSCGTQKVKVNGRKTKHFYK